MKKIIFNGALLLTLALSFSSCSSTKTKCCGDKAKECCAKKESCDSKTKNCTDGSCEVKPTAGTTPTPTPTAKAK